jgi:cyclophilin family peptidyl-prolyl cis-trans isomerase
MRLRNVLKVLGLLAVMGMISCTCSHEPVKPDSKGAPVKEAKMLKIETEYGTIDIELYPKEAPKTCARIAELAQKGFYNGVVFHRVVPGFVVQGGDPTGTGTGGSGQKLPAEFNAHKHVEGTVAMARTSDPDSADSQFYIALGTIPHLDGSYTVFGQVTKGMDAVKKIKQGDKMVKVTAE